MIEISCQWGHAWKTATKNLHLKSNQNHCKYMNLYLTFPRVSLKLFYKSWKRLLIIETFAFKWESPPSYSRWLTLPGWIPKKSSRTQQYYSYVNFICHPKLLSIHELLFGLRTNFLNETKQNTLSKPRALHGIFRNIWNE